MPLHTWEFRTEPIKHWPEELEIGPNDAPECRGEDWQIRKYTLHGGRSEGVELIELNNGPLSLHIAPTRGMGIWKGNYQGIPLGWKSPVAGPVHPHFVNVESHGGLGFLTGFDEFLCRCGLKSNGPPGSDKGVFLPLHGRIANTPAQRVTVGVHGETSQLSVEGVVEEAGLFLGRLRLTSRISTTPDSSEFVVHDTVENLSATPAEMQLLYHVNVGEPLLDAGSRLLVSHRELAPHTPHAASAIDHFDLYAGPVAGFPEEVFDFIPADDGKESIALIRNSGGYLGLAIFWDPRELPCFIQWKNTGAREDGYVTGLEPSTNFPYFKSHERQHGRVVTLQPGAKWSATLRFKVCDSPAAVQEVAKRIAAIQQATPVKVHATPVWGPVGH